MKPFDQWTVLPHDQLTAIDPDILSVTGSLHMPLGDVHRRMTVVRLADHRLILYSVIALDEAEMVSLESYGTPAFLIVPSDIHRMDAKIWKHRYPRMHVITPPGARAKVAEVVTVDATAVNFGDPSVQFVIVPGTDAHEAALIVERQGETTLIVNDLIFNEPDQPGFGGWVKKAVGITGDEPHIPGFMKMLRVKDAKALRAQLEQWSHLPNLRRIVVSHGEIIQREPAHVLEELAAKLAA